MLTFKDEVVVLRRFGEGVELYNRGVVDATHDLHLWFNIRILRRKQTESPRSPLRMFARCGFRVRISPNTAIRKREADISEWGMAPQSLGAFS